MLLGQQWQVQLRWQSWIEIVEAEPMHRSFPLILLSSPCAQRLCRLHVLYCTVSALARSGALHSYTGIMHYGDTPHEICSMNDTTPKRQRLPLRRPCCVVSWKIKAESEQSDRTAIIPSFSPSSYCGFLCGVQIEHQFHATG
jgi:hypothetical protein